MMQFPTSYSGQGGGRPAPTHQKDTRAPPRKPAPVSNEVFSTNTKIVMVVAPFFTLILLIITLSLMGHVPDVAVKSLGGITGVIGGCQLILAIILGKYYHDQQKVLGHHPQPLLSPENSSDGEVVIK